ncbi:MAG: pseudouridine synthase [Gammaproteobacteria bacterium]|jgi:23S rRNA pseudouridine2605 synthase|nr:pseudouridine synthase [Gammaproteobacteria bacterium]
MSEIQQSEKIQKVLSRYGYGSRREIETWLSAGRIQLNNQLAKLGDRMTHADSIKLDGRLVIMRPEVAMPKVLMYYKPVGEVCSRKDPEGRPTVFDALPKVRDARWIMIGRLDFNTSGLLMFTTHGELANALMHPRQQVEREYAVRVFGSLTEEQIKILLKGVELEDGFAQFKDLKDQGGEGHNHWYHVVLTEGRNREVRRMFEYFNMVVSRLIRVRFGDLTLPRDLPRGKTLMLTDPEVKTLFKSVGLKIG